MSQHDNIKVRIKSAHSTKGRALLVTYIRDDGLDTWVNLPTSLILASGKNFVVIPRWLAMKERFHRRSIDDE